MKLISQDDRKTISTQGAFICRLIWQNDQTIFARLSLDILSPVKSTSLPRQVDLAGHIQSSSGRAGAAGARALRQHYPNKKNA